MQLCTCGNTKEQHFPFGHGHRPYGRLLCLCLVETDDTVPLFRRTVAQLLYANLARNQIMSFFSASTITATITRIQWPGTWVMAARYFAITKMYSCHWKSAGCKHRGKCKYQLHFNTIKKALRHGWQQVFILSMSIKKPTGNRPPMTEEKRGSQDTGLEASGKPPESWNRKKKQCTRGRQVIWATEGSREAEEPHRMESSCITMT